MKTFKNLVPEYVEYRYTCEYCGNESKNDTLILNCENECKKKLSCEHDFEYEMEGQFEQNNIEIERICRKCNYSQAVEIYPPNVKPEIVELFCNNIEGLRWK